MLNNQEKIDRVYCYYPPITKIFKTGEWQNKRCFIVAGGESLEKFNFDKLKNEKVIGINKAFISYPDLDITYFMDTPFYESIRSGQQDKIEKKEVKKLWASTGGYKISLSPRNIYKFDKEVYCIRRNQFPILNKDLKEGIYGGSCSAFGALGLAILLGANPIYFLGLDLQVKNRMHFHEGYAKQTKESLEPKLERYKKQFEKFAFKFQERAKIINLGMEETTSLRCFPLKRVEEILGGNSVYNDNDNENQKGSLKIES